MTIDMGNDKFRRGNCKLVPCTCDVPPLFSQLKTPKDAEGGLKQVGPPVLVCSIQQ